MIAVVLPCYKVKNQIIKVLQSFDKDIDLIIVVDDCCPQESGKFVEKNFIDERLTVLYNKTNLGVGGAVKTGYLHAIQLGADIIIKVDGDGQMDPSLIPNLIKPLLNKTADYVKGNRFYHPKYLSVMPFMRIFGNSCLSLLLKIVSGYWNIMDPTNGFTAIHKAALVKLNLNKINNRYFFESDMLINLNLIQAVVSDYSMFPKYNSEESSLSIRRTLIEFPIKLVKAFIKRILYQYFIRDFNIGSLYLVFGNILFWFGMIFGLISWIKSYHTGVSASSGTVMLAAMPIILGFQILLSAVSFDINNLPKKPLQWK